MDKEKDSDVYEANVEDKSNHAVYARLSKQCVQALELKADTDVKVKVQFVLNRLPFCEWHRGIDCLPDPRILFPEPTYDSLLSGDGANNAWMMKKLLLDGRLNKKQREAISVIVEPNRSILPPILLLGPYGTGKTFTLAQALLYLLYQDPTNKILLCTQSNSAADLYVKEFFDSWYNEKKNDRFKPIRIYYKGRARNTVSPPLPPLFQIF